MKFFRNLFNLDTKLKKEILYKKLLIISLVINLVFVGALLNINAMIANGGKMPVPANSYWTEDEAHIPLDNPQLAYLTDKIPFLNYIWSIGDFVMIGAFIIVVVLITVNLPYFIRYDIYVIRNWKKGKIS